MLHQWLKEYYIGQDKWSKIIESAQKSQKKALENRDHIGTID